MDRNIFPGSLSLILTSTQPTFFQKTGGSLKQTITGILQYLLFVVCLFVFIFLKFCILYSPFLVLFQLAFPVIFWESQQSPQWSACLAFCMFFDFITYNSLIIYFEGSDGLAFWRISLYVFLFLFLCLFLPHPSYHYLRMYYNHSLGCKSVFDFCSVFLDLRNHTLCEWRSQIQTLLPVILRKCDILHVCVWHFICTDYCYPSRFTAVLSDPWDGIF